MLRHISKSILVPALLLAGLSGARGADDPRFALEFVENLREKGLHDVALQYLDLLRKDPETPPDLKKLLDLEEGRTLIGEAARTTDPDINKAKLEQAKVKIEAFVQANPDLPQTSEALVELARLLYERGNAEADLATEARNANDKDAKLGAARGYYGNSRNMYNRAFERLNGKLAEFPKYIPNEDPRVRDRERLRNTVMQAELQKTIVDYYEAQTFAAGSKERNEILEKARVAFEDVYKRYRKQRAGITARMWQGKCYEEEGKLGEATGIYKEILDHTDPALLELQKQTDYFRIIVTGKRKEYALAADECVNWLKMFPKDRRSYEALGVQFELAKDLIAQLPELNGADRDKALRLATDYLADVVRVVSPFKPEAIALLQKYRPNAAINAADVLKLNYDDAVAQAGQAISTLAYDNAIQLLRHAIVKAGPNRDHAKVNSARYLLAYCEMMKKRYYEAEVVAEHVARRYPRDEWAPKAADLAMQAIVEAYNTFTGGNRTSDLDRLVDLARYTAETWPETDQGDSGRLTLGLVSLGLGRYDDAISAFESVRSASPKWVDAQSSCGDAYWKRSLTLRDRGNTKEAEEQAAKALEKLNLALKARRDANAPATDVGLVNNACDLAVIDLETGKAAEALSLLEPYAKALAGTTNRSPAQATAYSRVVANVLRGHVATDKVDLAVADMKTLESSGGAGNGAAQLYFELGRLLEKEIEALKKRNDSARLKRTEASYQQFLKALVASKTGQSFQSLRWAADQLLKLGSAKEANEVYSNLVNTYGKDPAFLKAPDAFDQILFVKLKQVAALRTIGDLPESESTLNELIQQNPRSALPQKELGYLLEAKAEKKQAKWVDAYNHWKTLALKLAKMNPRPREYYEAWYEAAVCLKKKGDAEKTQKADYALARTTLASVMRLSPTLGGDPEMKLKYETLLKELGK